MHCSSYVARERGGRGEGEGRERGGRGEGEGREAVYTECVLHIIMLFIFVM